jgi:hypothetical protein
MKGKLYYNPISGALISNFIGVRTEVKNTHFSSKAYGQRDSKETSLEGRLQLDVLQFMQREHKLRSYSLNSVCAQFLGEQKEDVHHSVITDLQNGTPESRRRLAVYCLKVSKISSRLTKVPSHRLCRTSRMHICRRDYWTNSCVSSTISKCLASPGSRSITCLPEGSPSKFYVSCIARLTKRDILCSHFYRIG